MFIDFWASRPVRKSSDEESESAVRIEQIERREAKMNKNDVQHLIVKCMLFSGKYQVCPRNFREMSRTCSWHFLDNSWTFPGNARDISGHFREISWKCSGNVQDISWKLFPGNFREISGEISRTFPGNPDSLLNFRGQIPGNFRENLNR